MLDSSFVLRIRGLRLSLNMPRKHKSVPPCGVFPLLCPDVNRHSEPQLQQSKPLCCSSLLLDTWKQSVYFPPQKELCGSSAHKKRTYGSCRFSVSFQNVCFLLKRGNRENKQRLTGLFAIVISSCSPCLDWVHIVHRNKCLWLTGCVQSDCRKMFSKSPHLSQLTCPLLDMNWEGSISGNRNKGQQRSRGLAPEMAQTCFKRTAHMENTIPPLWHSINMNIQTDKPRRVSDLSISGCWGNCQLSDRDQYVCYQVKGPLYEWHCHLPRKNNILTAAQWFALYWLMKI